MKLTRRYIMICIEIEALVNSFFFFMPWSVIEPSSWTVLSVTHSILGPHQISRLPCLLCRGHHWLVRLAKQDSLISFGTESHLLVQIGVNSGIVQFVAEILLLSWRVEWIAQFLARELGACTIPQFRFPFLIWKRKSEITWWFPFFIFSLKLKIRK